MNREIDLAAPANTKSTDPIDYQNIGKPLGGMPKHYAQGDQLAMHRHERAQLIYAVAGVMEITTECGVWMVPPQRALWIPGDVKHGMSARTDVELRTLFVNESAFPGRTVQVVSSIEVLPFLRELIVATVGLPIDYEENRRNMLLIELLLEEIICSTDGSLHIAVANDKRLLKVCHLIRRNPEDDRSLDELGGLVGASGRTLARLARRELGVPFSYWRQQVKVFSALPLLDSGAPISLIAASLGYQTSSAFTETFRKMLGVTPSQYIKVTRQSHS
jgi:AraC-like DNA-binding protein/quercetin dioxygenase-like cupin family protein